jgi:hypothetical protein
MMTRLQTKRANSLSKSYDEVSLPTSEMQILLNNCLSKNNTNIFKIECILGMYKIQNSHLEYFIKINDLRGDRNRLYMVTYTKSFYHVTYLTNYMNKNTLTKKQTKLFHETIQELKTYQKKYNSFVVDILTQRLKKLNDDAIGIIAEYLF